jgi:hypothetical protein
MNHKAWGDEEATDKLIHFDPFASWTPFYSRFWCFQIPREENLYNRICREQVFCKGECARELPHKKFGEIFHSII